MKKSLGLMITMFCSTVLVTLFQNCGEKVQFADIGDGQIVAMGAPAGTGTQVVSEEETNTNTDTTENNDDGYNSGDGDTNDDYVADDDKEYDDDYVADDETSTEDDYTPPTENTETVVVDDNSPGKSGDAPGKKNDDSNNDYNNSDNVVSDDDNSGPLNYICILDGPGKSVRAGFDTSALVQVGRTPMTVCTSQAGCNLIGQKYTLKSIEKRGFCKNGGGHSVQLTEAQIAAQL